MSLLFRALGLALAGVAVLVAAMPVLDWIPIVRGSLPANHALAAYGIDRARVPRVPGKRFVVTGASSGVGLGTAKLLAEAGGVVHMACRSASKCARARDAILAAAPAVPGDRLVCETVDLTSLASVRAYADAYKRAGHPLHGLVLNAGVMYPPFALTEDGLESTWGVNHVAHALLARELLPVLVRSAPATIVSVASNAHFIADANDDVHTFNDPATYDVAVQYGRSKLANILFARELARRIPTDQRVYVNALNPGAVRGELYRHLPGPLVPVAEWFQNVAFWDEEHGALTSVGAAVSPLVLEQGVTGEYFVPIFRRDAGSFRSRNATLAKLWFDETEKILRNKGF